MQTSDNLLDELHNLRRTIRDLVALSMLPVVWADYNLNSIAESLAEVLLNTLELDLIYIRLQEGNGGKVIEVARSSQPDADVQARKVGQTLSPILGPMLRILSLSPIHSDQGCCKPPSFALGMLLTGGY